MKDEICENCGTKIGQLERAYVHNEHIVCKSCYEKLNGSIKQSLSIPKSPKKSWIWVAILASIIVGIIGLTLGLLLNQPQGKTAYEDAYLRSKELQALLRGNEIVLAQITADNDKYFGESFVIFGGVQIDNRYVGPYINAQTTHYCFDFAEFTADLKPTRYDATLYVNKNVGKTLVDEVMEFGKKKGDVYMCMRLYVTMTGTDFFNRPVFEILDWQLAKKFGKGWQPWAQGVAPEN